jgi:hypothetical protein
MTPEEKRQNYLARLRHQVAEYFVKDEFIVMCSDLGIEYDELRQGGLEVQANELVQRLEKQGRISDLVAYCSQKRPNVSWDDPDSLGDVLTKTLRELKGDLANFQASFQSALQQIDILSDYKLLHDCLHDLKFSWLPVVRKSVEGLPDAKGAIQDLRGYERELRTSIGKLDDTVDNKKVPGTERAWINKLREARQDLRQGLSSAEPDMKLIETAVDSISQVLDTQPTYINNDLVQSVGALRLPQLKEIVQLVLDKLIAKAPESDIVKQFQQGIADLNQMNSDLDALMDEHDIWQANERITPMMFLIIKDLSSFSILWQQLKSKTSRFYKSKTEEWATDLQADETSVDNALEGKLVDPTKIDSAKVDSTRGAFNLFYEDGKLRFLDVDKLIKQKCKELSAIRSKMPPDDILA